MSAVGYSHHRLSPLTAALVALACIFLFVSSAHATVYNVGPGQTYTSIGSVPWESLHAGDTVNIYWRSTPYYEKWDVGVVGTSGSPVTIHGVPDGSGNLPIIDGNGATTRSQLAFGSQTRGIIEMQYGTTAPPSCHSAYVTIENLEIRNASTPYTFKGYAGDTQSWVAQSAGIWIVDGLNVTIRNCYIHDCGNGIMTYSDDSGSCWTQDFLIEGNYVTACGVSGSTQQHDTYCETYRITYQYNRYGPPRGTPTASIGNALKDRSAGMVARFNWIDGGNRTLDLVEVEDSTTLYGKTEYQKTFVYGNILIEENDAGNSQVVHFGWDNTSSRARPKGYFYNNTVVSLRTGTTVMFMSTGSTFLDCRNNIMYVTAAGNTLQIVNDSTCPVNMTHNWLKTGYVLHGSGGGTVNDDGTSVTGSSPSFVNEGGQDYHITSGSQCVNAGTSQHADCSSYPVNQEYVKHQQHTARAVNGTIDIGAYEYGGGSALTITTSSLPVDTVGIAYSQTLAATGGTTPYTWSLQSGSLPAGLSLVASTGAITGTPTTAGTSNFTAKVTDNVAATATKALSIVINVVPSITTSSLPNGSVGVSYSQTMAATGGTTPYVWWISSGSLPAGLSLNTSTGAITGTPTAAGTSNFTARVTDTPGATATKALSIVIVSGLTITTSSLPADTINIAYNRTLTASGGTTPYTWAISSGTLPTGLSLNTSSGAITGTPTAAGTSNFTARVTDNVGATATKALSIVINAALSITTSSLPNGTVGSAYNQTLARSGGTTPFTWATSSGSLPAGLTLVASSGAISGTPTASGTSSFTARVTDNVGATATKALSIVVTSGGTYNVTLQDGLNGYAGTTDDWMTADYPTTNYGTGTNGHLQYNTQDRQVHQFNLSSIPSNATITSATLSIYVYQVSGGTPNINCYRILKQWDEMQVTYNNRLTGTAWGTPGLLSGTDYAATAIATSGNISAAGWANFTVTSTVQSWVNGSQTNYGVMYKLSSAGHLYTRMSDYTTDTTLRPKLTITYTVP